MLLASTTKAPPHGSRQNPAEAWQCAWWADPCLIRKDGTASNRTQSWTGVLRLPNRSVMYFEGNKTRAAALSSARGYGYRHFSQSDRAKAIRAEAELEPAVG